MTLFILSFIAGVLTVAAPCILPLLPVIIGGSLIDTQSAGQTKQWIKPITIAISLAVSVVVFTLLIKATTVLLGVPHVVWQSISGIIILLLGIQFIWPQIWERIAAQSFIRSNLFLQKANQRSGAARDILIGSALGPVFSSCSPTYALIVATILPASFTKGLLYLIAYAVGMSATLLLIALLGQAFTSKLAWLSNPEGWFIRTMGIIFIMVGVAVLLGLDKDLQAFVLEKGWYDPIGDLERQLAQ